MQGMEEMDLFTFTFPTFSKKSRSFCKHQSHYDPIVIKQRTKMYLKLFALSARLHKDIFKRIISYFPH